MANKKTTALSTEVSSETLAALSADYPVEAGAQRIMLPRLGFVSQDKTEEVKDPKTGKKKINIVTEAGTFFTEVESDETDSEGKKVWTRSEIGTEVKDVVIIFQRKQLRYFDSTTQEFTSSPVYDNDTEIVPLFCNKAQVHRGTPEELRKLPQFQVTENGKTKTKLEDNRILYVLLDGIVYQMNLRGSSMWAFRSWARKVLPPSVLVTLNSESKTAGSNNWNQMTFTVQRKLTESEGQDILAKVQDIKATIQAEKDQYGTQSVEYAEEQKKVDKAF